MPNVAYIILAVLGFGFIIFIHELGHFLAAKLFRVKVKAFSLGFPPTVLHKQIGETDYRLGLILMGGYVSMVGEDPTEATPDDPRSLNNIKAWKRAVVFLAGVGMNLVSAVAIFMIASFVGIQVDAPIVGNTVFPSPARSAGFQPGDRLLTIDDYRIDAFKDIKGEVIFGGITDPQHRLAVRVEGRQKPILVATTADEGLPSIGIIQAAKPIVAELDRKSAAMQAGLRQGDLILAINGEPVSYSAQCKEMLNPMPKEPFTIEVERTLTVPAPAPSADEKTPTPPDELKEGEEGDLVVSIDGEKMKSPADARATLALRSKTDPAQPSKIVLRRTLVIDPASLKEPDYGLDPQLIIKDFMEGSVAQAAGMKVDDMVRKVGAIDYPTLYQTIKAVQDSNGTPLSFEVWRDGETITIPVTPKLDDLRGYCMIGVTFGYPEKPIIRRLGKPGAATTDAGIPEGATIVSVAGKDIGDWTGVTKQIIKAEGKPVEIGYSAPGIGKVEKVTVTPRQETPEVFLAGFIDKPITETLPPMNPIQAVAYTYKEFSQLVRLQYATVVGMTNHRVPAKEIGGPVRIGFVFYKTAEQGLSKYFSFLALISVVIALLNILPIPPLDGGHVMFLCVEGIIRRPVPIKVRTVVSTIGLVALLSLVLFAFWNDGWWVFQNFIQ